MAEVILLEGYVTPSHGAKSRSKKGGKNMAKRKRKGNSAQMGRFGAASHKCKGLKIKAFRACVRKHAKK